MNRIKIYTPKFNRITSVDLNNYTLNSRGKFPLIQKYLFKLLKWMGCNQFKHEDLCYEDNSVVVQTDSIVKQCEDTIKYIVGAYNRVPDCILVGNKEFCEMANLLSPIVNPLQFALGGHKFSKRVNSSYGNLGMRSDYVWEFFDCAQIKIVIVPWMEGFLPLMDMADIQYWER